MTKIMAEFYWISLNLSYRAADIKKKRKNKNIDLASSTNTDA